MVFWNILHKTKKKVHQKNGEVVTHSLLITENTVSSSFCISTLWLRIMKRGGVKSHIRFPLTPTYFCSFPPDPPSPPAGNMLNGKLAEHYGERKCCFTLTHHETTHPCNCPFFSYHAYKNLCRIVSFQSQFLFFPRNWSQNKTKHSQSTLIDLLFWVLIKSSYEYLSVWLTNLEERHKKRKS